MKEDSLGGGDPRAARGEELAALDRLIAAAESDPRPGAETITLEGSRALLREAVLVAIDEAGEDVASGCTQLLRGQAPASHVEAGVEHLRALLRGLGDIDRPA